MSKITIATKAALTAEIIRAATVPMTDEEAIASSKKIRELTAALKK